MPKLPLDHYFRLWREHPAQMVRDLFGVEPDPWQVDVLEAFPHSPRLAMAACKGPGKTAVLAWIGWNFLLTRKNPKCAATSISGDNLRDNLWTEMSKWQQRCPLLAGLFTWTKERIFANENPNNWFMAARTYSQSGDAAAHINTLAGIHEDYVLFLLDESGGMTDSVMVSAEAALSSCIEGHIVQAGNPTQLGGPLYRASQNEHDLWHITHITAHPDDPKRTPRVSVQWARDFISQWGVDSDWTRVTIYGLFPRASFNALIGPDEVRAAMRRGYREFEIASLPRIMGIDVARYGDDSSVIAKRQGMQAFNCVTFRGVNSSQGASAVNREWAAWGADAVFIDDTGGFGSGWIDKLGEFGRAPIGIHFAAQAHEKLQFENKRAEMYFDFCEWIKAGGALPDDKDLLEDLTNTTYTTPKGILILEPKALIKAKQHGRSPDKADAFALTFAEPVTISRHVRAIPRIIASNWNPYAEVDNPEPRGYHPMDWNPYG